MNNVFARHYICKTVKCSEDPSVSKLKLHTDFSVSYRGFFLYTIIPAKFIIENIFTF